MRILIAAHGFPPTHSAGAERRAQRMAVWLAQQGHEVEVFAFESLNADSFEIKAEQETAGYIVHRLYDRIDFSDGLQKTYDNPAVGKAFRQVIAAGNFDLVHMVSGYLLAGQVIHTAQDYGIPVVITLTEYWFLCARLNLIQPTGALCSGPESDQKCGRCLLESKRRYRLPAQYLPSRATDIFWQFAGQLPFAQASTEAIAERRVKLRAALDAADLVICPSQTLIDMFGNYGFDTRRFMFMRQGLNIPAQLPAVQPASTMRFVYIGQIQEHKGVDLLVEAAIHLLNQGYDLRLDLWGSDHQAPDYTQQLQARSQDYPAIHWNGPFLGDKGWDILAHSDVLVIPSRWHENSPNVILEAYTMGLPAIGTNLGGMAELVQHEKSGLLFELNNAADLSAQMQRLIDDPTLLAQLRRNIPVVKTINDEMEDLMDHYERLIAEKVTT